MCLMVAVLSLILSAWLISDNKKMDKDGLPEVQEFEETSVDAQVAGQHERHRYIW